MAARKRQMVRPRPPARKKLCDVIEGDITFDEQQGVILWDFIPQNTDEPKQPAHGVVTGGLVDQRFVGKRVRVTIEEL